MTYNVFSGTLNPTHFTSPGFSEYREDNSLRMFLFRKQLLLRRRPSTDVFETLPYDVALAAVESLLRRFS